jgi:hypothetical protein
MIDASKSWATNQWVGYSIRNIGQALGSQINSNTSNTISYSLNGSTGHSVVFNAGDQYQIHKVLRGLDSAGAGKGDVVTGNPLKNQSFTRPAPGWPNQLQEPTFTWNNRNATTGACLGFTSNVPFQKLNRDFFNLGCGFAADTTPQAVRDALPASINGVQYNGTFVYPHPLVTAAPAPTPSATRGPSTTSRKKAKKAKKKKRWPKIGE